jgi:hypothetical protein
MKKKIEYFALPGGLGIAQEFCFGVTAVLDASESCSPFIHSGDLVVLDASLCARRGDIVLVPEGECGRLVEYTSPCSYIGVATHVIHTLRSAPAPKFLPEDARARFQAFLHEREARDGQD